ncbi:MAG TPA: tripartite tricarboxylate transporter substrate binding protein [Burkholderiales bacterium]|jgi:tripartite-type tricarboxylate transporter receptor subunit TctC
MNRHRRPRAFARTTITFAAIACALALTTSAAQAQSYPARPIRLVVPFPAGGGTDAVARLIGLKLGAAFGQSIIADNRPGAAGAIGCEQVARSAPDGYTLLMGTTGTHVTNVATTAHLSYDPLKDFAPVQMVADIPFILVANPSVKANNVRELIALARQKPDGVTYASSGPGGISHLGFELFNSMAGTKMLHVPYKGSPLQTEAVVAGEVNLTMDSAPVTVPFIKAGRIRALGVASARRSALLPDVPTIAEAGLPGYEMQVWYGIFAPAATPPEVLRKLQDGITRALADSDMRDKLASLGAVPGNAVGAEFGALVKRDLVKWTKVARDAKVKLN